MHARETKHKKNIVQSIETCMSNLQTKSEGVLIRVARLITGPMIAGICMVARKAISEGTPPTPYDPYYSSLIRIYLVLKYV
jgi:hypothetical protein